MKKKKTGEYRNLRLMEGRIDRWEFDVKLKSGEWYTLTNINVPNESERIQFAQNTANGWMNK